MEITGSTNHVDVTDETATQAIDQTRLTGSGHIGIRDQHGIGAQARRVAVEEGIEIRAADLFLAFQPYFDVEREFAVGGEEAFERFDVDEELAFVIAGTARVEVLARDSRVERRGTPGAQGLDRLHIVVSIQQQGRLVGRGDGIGVDAGSAAVGAGDEDDTRQAERLKVFG